jgi:hypothetical protein
MPAVLFFLLGTQMISGLVLAGTDLYFPPFGHEFAEWATGSGEDHAGLVGLVLSDIKEGDGLISAMFSGRKVFSEEPRE